MTEVPVRPPFDREAAVALAAIADQLEPVTPETISAMRSRGTPLDLSDDALADVGITRRDLAIAGYNGDEITVSVLERAGRTGTGPGIFHTHGGGMITGDRMVGVQQLLPWIVEHDAVVVTVEYRLAPEFPDPYPVEDCYAGLRWTAAHAAELGIDPERLLIAGASAGGGLAAGVTLMARDRNGPRLLGQLLICPMIDDRDTPVSTAQYPDEGTWVRSSNRTGWNALLGERRGTDEVSVYAAPARATDLSGLPPAFIDCGSAEVFRDEDVAYASALWRDGVQAELHVWPGGFHGFDMLAPQAAVSQAATAARDAWVARLFGA
ncbi:alpha/beta hydrolase [Nocardiopsis sp. HNM0947]|uniref:Alpha/beta hydrolase n=1 Tax=Nocardiopsis coralli TaxID=2772213 RepID=A0ABR9P9L9_9ACTN|nr:alpha/beta hydrolase [Nocardiopsis coralli]MBE3000534.1 alpha/beta hydrolase [Nocardiopsis coralli]